jgi:hypothetical protein
MVHHGRIWLHAIERRIRRVYTRLCILRDILVFESSLRFGEPQFFMLAANQFLPKGLIIAIVKDQKNKIALRGIPAQRSRTKAERKNGPSSIGSPNRIMRWWKRSLRHFMKGFHLKTRPVLLYWHTNYAPFVRNGLLTFQHGRYRFNMTCNEKQIEYDVMTWHFLNKLRALLVVV